MHRCYIAPTGWSAGALVPDAEEAHHITHVLRVRAGETVIVFDGRGRRAEARVLPGKRVALEPIPGTEQRQPAPPLITLYQAIIKGNRMDLLIEKAAELGATAIVPLLTARTVVKLDREQAAERRERWQRIAVSAAKQCGQDWLPEVFSPVPLDKALGDVKRHALCLLGSLQPGAPGVRQVIAERGAARGTLALASGADLAWIIGPEGDLTPEEHAACVAAGAVPVRMGPRVLRAETAAMFALSVLVGIAE